MPTQRRTVVGGEQRGDTWPDGTGAHMEAPQLSVTLLAQVT